MASFIFSDEELELIATIECATEFLTEASRDQEIKEIEILNVLEEVYPELDLKLLARYMEIKGKTAIRLGEKLKGVEGEMALLS